eukprot:jgi/Chrzof1/460/Cz01g16190.t1
MSIRCCSHDAHACLTSVCHAGSRFNPPGSVHCPFYPWRGPYSSSDPVLIQQHIQELLDANVTVLAVSWWGPVWREGTHDTQGVQTDEVLKIVMTEVEKQDTMKVALHLEPYTGRTAQTVREDIEYLMTLYNSSSALLRIADRPVYYVYDSYHLLPQQWSTLLSPDGSRTVRGTTLDGFFIGLWLNEGDGDSQIIPAGFDGFYTYFANEAVSYGSNPQNWNTLANWARSQGRLFSVSIGPGYNDTLIRPWNAAATRDRDDSKRYTHSWLQAIASGADIVSITSFNEWGEGTQIEPAKPWTDLDSNATYLDYGSNGPHHYLDLTRTYATQFKKLQHDKQQCGLSKGAECSLASNTCPHATTATAQHKCFADPHEDNI